MQKRGHELATTQSGILGAKTSTVVRSESSRGKRRDVCERGIGVRGAERAKLRAEGVDDLLVRHRKDELERVCGRPRRFGAVREELARL